MKCTSFDSGRLPHLSSGDSHRSYRDRSGRFHFGFTANASDRGEWLRRTRLWLLSGKALTRDQPAFLLGCVVLLDGVTDLVDLQAAWRALPELYRDGEAVCLDWLAPNGAQNRRILSAVSVLAWSAQQTPPPDLQEVTSQFLACLKNAASQPGMSTPLTLEQLLAWTQGGLLVELSGDLFAHVSRADPLTAVPRSCLARRRRRLALAAAKSDEVLPEHVVPEMLLMDALQSGESHGGTDCVLAIQTACRADASGGASYAQRRRMLSDLYALVPAVSASGVLPSLLLLWAIDMVRIGTRRTRPLSPHTIDPYVQLSLGRLYKQLAGVDLTAVSSVDFGQVYAPILADPTVEPSQMGKLAAALTAFHEFLETVLDAPALESRLDADAPDSSPRANVIWPHETDWIFAQWSQASEDDRLVHQLNAVMSLLVSACVRIQDAWHVHVFGVRLTHGSLVVAVDPLPSAGAGKSASARREIEVEEPRCRRFIVAWLERRQAEGAMPRDLLFGDPSEPRRAWRRGATEYLLNRWLKAATGDRDVGTHSLRHTFATLARSGFDHTAQRDLDTLSARAGHSATRTTITSYVHLYEEQLRRQLDRSIGRLRLSEPQLCQLTDSRAGWIRKRWNRAKGDPRVVTWIAIAERAARVDLPDVTDGFAFDAPSCPDMPQEKTWTFQLVLDCLGDLANGYSPSQTQLRRGISADALSRIEALIAAWRPASGSGPCEPPEAQWCEGFRRINQPKWKPILVRLREAANGDIAQAASSWRGCFRSGHLSLERPDNALPLLEFLEGCRIRSEQLVISHQLEPSDGVLVQTLSLFRTVFGGTPTVQLEQVRRGRPSIRLSIRSVRLSERPPSSAAQSMWGLEAFMLTAWVFASVAGRPE